MSELTKSKLDLSRVKVVIGRGGLLRPIASGIYRVTEKMKADLRKGYMGEHASNLGGLIADDFSRSHSWSSGVYCRSSGGRRVERLCSRYRTSSL